MPLKASPRYHKIEKPGLVPGFLRLSHSCNSNRLPIRKRGLSFAVRQKRIFAARVSTVVFSSNYLSYRRRVLSEGYKIDPIRYLLPLCRERHSPPKDGCITAKTGSSAAMIYDSFELISRFGPSSCRRVLTYDEFPVTVQKNGCPIHCKHIAAVDFCIRKR